jgi:hypothetical protein
VTIDIAITERGTVASCGDLRKIERIHEAIAALAASKAFSEDLPTVWDLSAVIPGILSADDMRAFSAPVSRVREGTARPRVGVVAPHDAVFGGVKMFTGVNADRIQTALPVSRDIEERKVGALSLDADAGADASHQ